MSPRPEHYVPAAGRDWLLPFYDPLLRLIFPEDALRRQMLEAAQIAAGDRVLDVGCGTGTFVLTVKRERPEAKVVGLDGDPKALAMARRKLDASGLDICLDEGLSYDMPYPDRSFERAVSSLVFHHLTPDHKRRTLTEIHRILVPGGVFLLLDFGAPVTRWNRALAHLFHRSESMRENVRGQLPARMREAGFAAVEELGGRGTPVGSIWTYRAQK